MELIAEVALDLLAISQKRRPVSGEKAHDGFNDYKDFANRLTSLGADLAMSSSLCAFHGLRFDPARSTGCIRCAVASAVPVRGWTRRRVLAGSTAIAVLGAVTAAARALHGTDSETREITYGPGHRGSLFVPQVDSSTPRPLIVLFDPGGSARAIVDRYTNAARQQGWIAASSYEVADGTADDADTDTMMLLLNYVRSHHAVDQARIFAGGFSGGACGAYRLAIVRSETVRGAIVECGHMASWRDVGDRADASLRFYLFTRDGDFNRPATRRLRDAMTAKRCRVTEVERQGGHAPMQDSEVAEAMRWMVAP